MTDLASRGKLEHTTVALGVSAADDIKGAVMQTPAPFGYARANTVDEAIELLAALGPEARLVAGGHSLLPMMKIRLAQPEHLIDINGL